MMSIITALQIEIAQLKEGRGRKKEVTCVWKGPEWRDFKITLRVRLVSFFFLFLHRLHSGAPSVPHSGT